MVSRVLRLIEDRLDPGSHADIAPSNRVVYVAEGEAVVRSGGVDTRMASNQARFASDAIGISAGSAGATLWRWELASDECESMPVSPSSEVASRVKLRAQIDLPDGDYLMRCDRVDFPLGGIAYTHVHQGPGIRCLYMGEFDVTVHGTTSHIRPGEPWFEAGPDPVYAEASKTERTAFIRVMILPRRLQGKSSIRYVNEEDARKPKTQTYTVFVDEPIQI